MVIVEVSSISSFVLETDMVPQWDILLRTVCPRPGSAIIVGSLVMNHRLVRPRVPFQLNNAILVVVLVTFKRNVLP